MAYYYQQNVGKNNNNHFTLYDRADTVNETQYGIGATDLYYPNVSTCTTVTLLLSDDTLIGAHFAKPDPVVAVDAIINQLNVVRAGRAVQQIYVIGVLRERDSEAWMADSRYGWPVQLSTFNTAFGRNKGDLVQGYVQPFGGVQHYRVRAAGGGNAIAYSKPGKQPMADGPWNNLTLVGL